jgi:hypothetical protein
MAPELTMESTLMYCCDELPVLLPRLNPGLGGRAKLPLTLLGFSQCPLVTSLPLLQIPYGAISL